MEIGAWGASVTYGQGDEESLGWVGRLRKEQKDEVYNRGVCGHTTEDLLRRFDTELESIKPKLILLSIGLNDSKYPKGKHESFVPLDRYEQNLITLIGKARSYTDDILVVGLTNVCSPLETERGSIFKDEVIVTYNEALKKCAERESLIFIDMFGILDVEKDFSDGLHPNAAGYEKMFQKIKHHIH